jgi:hypothetical protein
MACLKIMQKAVVNTRMSRSDLDFPKSVSDLL